MSFINWKKNKNSEAYLLGYRPSHVDLEKWPWIFQKLTLQNTAKFYMILTDQGVLEKKGLTFLKGKAEFVGYKVR